MDITVTTPQLQKLLGVKARSTFNDWKKVGFDVAVIKHGQWNLNIALEWWLNNIYSGDSKGDTPSITKEKLRYAVANADKMEIQVATLRGDLKPKDEIHEEWAARAAVIVNGLTMYEGRLPPLLEGKTQGEMRAIIKKENYRLRDWYCKQGEYTPGVDESKGEKK